MSQSGSSKKVANSLLALSSAAVMAVYTAGYTRTRSAAQRFEVQAEQRSAAVAGSPRTASPVAEAAPNAASVPIRPAPAPAAPSQVSRPAAVEPKPVTFAKSAPPKADVPEVALAPAPVETPAPIAASAPVADQAVEIAALLPAAPVVAPPPAPPTAPAQPAAPAAPLWKDGTYYGWGTSRHGDIQAAVVIEGGRIASATIAQCRTRYSCSVIGRLPPEVAARQSPDVDFVSGATQSANAFYYAVVEALGKAK